MDLTLTLEQKVFRDELRSWLENHVPAPFVGNAHTDNPEYVEHLRTWQNQLFQAGWNGLTWPEAYGGRGRSLPARSGPVPLRDSIPQGRGWHEPFGPRN